MTNYELIPKHMREGARLYIEEGIKPGHFLKAVLENNFIEACGRGDSINRARLLDWADFIWNEIPSNVWGSPEKVRAWVESHEKVREVTP